MKSAAPEFSPRLHPLNQGFKWHEVSAEGARRLTPRQIDDYNKLGFFKLEGVFSREEIAEVVAAIDPLERAHEEFVAETQGGQYRLTRTGAITFSAHIVTKSETLRRFASHQVFKDVCHDLLGPDVRLYWDQSVYKKTEKLQEFPWHQDNGYNFTEPQEYVTCWAPLVDVDEQNGCPWLAPGLHRKGTLEHWMTDIGRKCLTDFADAICVPAKAGDLIVFSSLAPHRTGPNLRKDTVRKAYILQYAPDGAVVRSADGGAVKQDDEVRQFRILEKGR